MIALKAKIIYECPMCLMPYTFKFTLKTAVDVTRIANGANRLKRCTICSRYMRIKKSVFKTIAAEDEYGDDARGTWYCPDHIGLAYYPSVIRSATESTISTLTPIVTGKLMHYRYLKMASMQYPWKCPICSQTMLYRESKGV